MRKHENKLFLIALLSIFTLIFSGYTIRNADYMVIADEYIEKQSEMRGQIPQLDEEGLERLGEELSRMEDDFVNKVRDRYSSDISDRILLSLSYKKFRKSTDKIRRRMGEREENLTGTVSGMITVGAIEKKVEEKEEIEDRVISRTEEITEKIPALLVFAVLKDMNTDISDYPVVVVDEIRKSNLVLTADSDASVSQNTPDFLFFDTGSVNEDNIQDRIFTEKRPMFPAENGKDIETGDFSFKYENGRYNVFSAKRLVFTTDTLIIRTENGASGFGKAFIWNGKEFVNGAWLVDTEGKTAYYDNRGDTIKLYGEKMWLHTCHENDLKI